VAPLRKHVRRFLLRERKALRPSVHAELFVRVGAWERNMLERACVHTSSVRRRAVLVPRGRLRRRGHLVRDSGFHQTLVNAPQVVARPTRETTSFFATVGGTFATR